MNFVIFVIITLPGVQSIHAYGPYTRQDLAEMSGTRLYTVSRVLSEWERQGLVEIGRERVVIRNPHGVVSIAEELNQ